MERCPSQSSWLTYYKFTYYKENMQALGLPAPASIYGNITNFNSLLVAVSAVLQKLGKITTV